MLKNLKMVSNLQYQTINNQCIAYWVLHKFVILKKIIVECVGEYNARDK